eukprot:TRINITY_DN107001_c0_g2_i1.p1 TRINITY_DN107001_c0_g2~~TRINITY_DN107001_c0_g2_i1.p1  ORF type:complete len:104 (+),score=26.49 TRINITY_DN107001_c0_g2_i1:85-396(+)
MKKVTELEARKMYRQAIGQMPDLAQYAEFADEIKKKTADLKSRFETPSLFGEIEEHAASVFDESEAKSADTFDSTDPEEHENDKEDNEDDEEDEIDKDNNYEN